MYFGVELEVHGILYNEPIFRSYIGGRMSTVAIAKHDGSVSEGYEMCFVPLNLLDAQDVIWEQIPSNVYTDSGTGLHIHATIPDGLDGRTVGGFAELLTNYAWHYQGLRDKSRRTTLYYCNPREDFAEDCDFHRIRYCGSEKYSLACYSARNNTTEYRVWEATTDKDELKEALGWAAGLQHVAIEAAIEHPTDKIYRDELRSYAQRVPALVDHYTTIQGG
jgi:hypothetical protein